MILQVTFGSIFDPESRLGIVDEGTWTITTAVEGMEGIDLALLDSADDLKVRLRNNLTGLVLLGFDDRCVRWISTRQVRAEWLVDSFGWVVR